MPLMHIKMTGKLKGQTQFVSLSLTLGQDDTSEERWEESVLRSNPEVMGYHSKGYITFVTMEQAAQEKSERERREREAEAATETVESALEKDGPADERAAALINTAVGALQKLAELLAADGKPKPKTAKPEKAVEPIKDDGYDLPMSAPKGLEPRNQQTRDYLRMQAADKRKFLKECKDIGILREVALFETDAKIKVVARKAARNSEKLAEEATRMAQASVQ